MKSIIAVYVRVLVTAGIVLGLYLPLVGRSQTPPPYTWTTFAGHAGQIGTNDGPGSAARFYYPHGVSVDSTGNVYAVEIGNECVRKITPDGTVSTVVRLRAAQPYFNPYHGPWGVAVDSSGNIYVADTGDQTIRKITTDGVVSVLAGASGQTGSNNGTNGTARFYWPATLTVDGAGMVYVADWWNSLVREVTPVGVVTTLAGINLPSGVALDSAGNLYATSEGANQVDKVSSGGVVTTMAGGFNGPHGGAVDAGGNVYVADMNNYVVKRVAPDGTVTTIGGLARSYGSADGVGSAARFSTVRGVAVDTNGNIYVTDYDNQTIRKGVPFAVTAFPLSQAVLTGTSVTLSVAVSTGGGTFMYQWLFNGTTLATQTNNTLALGPVTRTNSGLYSVVVSNSVGNWLALGATVRALVPPLVRTPQITSNETVRLSFQDSDGGLPYDMSQVQVQWRTNLPSGTDTNWQSLTSPLIITNGFVECEDTSVTSHSAKFYRVWEH